MEVRNNSRGRTAARYLGQNRTALGKTLEKLSSGYRINRAADDAAGLAISEKMRLQITGTGRAYENSREGVGLIKTGEGALEEIHAMLDRAAYLAEQSANGTYQDELDRESLQKELEQLCSEIDRIATSANFNGIELFQDRGYPYEGSTAETLRAAAKKQAETRQETVVQQQKSAETVPQEKTAEIAKQPVREEVPAKPKVEVFFIEHDLISGVTQTPTGGANNLTNDPLIPSDDGSTKKLSEALEQEIVPQIVDNILKNYSAFSYMSGSSIGIGLRYYTENSSTLAYVEGGYSTAGTTSYTLGVNLHHLTGTLTLDKRQELETTIAHEMIHAFMDEATTKGMFGLDSNHTDSFPGWFKEGMAQTASGPGNWLKSTYININANTSEADILNQLTKSDTKLSADTSASRYGSGYVACMYLGQVIAGNGTIGGAVTAQSISLGLNKLLNEVIGGKSLNTAVNELTGGKIASISDFQTKFDNRQLDGLGQFVKDLLTASNGGFGGLASGDLQSSDLVPDTSPANSNPLFDLDPNNQKVQNTYPSGYPVQTGGSTSTAGTAPTDFNPTMPYTDYGNLRIYGAGQNDLEYDTATKKLTIKAGSGIVITMVNPSDPNIATAESIVLGEDENSKVSVTLDGVTLAGSKGLTIRGDTEVTYKSDHEFGSIDVETNAKAAFNGSAGLKAGSFNSDSTNEITFNGGSVVINNGSGTINGTVKINGTAIAAAITGNPTNSNGKPLESLAVPWSTQLGSLTGAVTSITIDGQKYDMNLPNGTNANLWLEPDAKHRVTFTDANGRTKTVIAEPVYEADGVTFKEFQFAEPPKPFTVAGTGIQEGVDWKYEDDGNTLVILSGKAMTIADSGDVDEKGNAVIGRIKVADSIGTANLTLNGVSSTVSNGSAFDLGKNNNVTINLADGTDNSFTSGENYAGISLGDGTNLTIIGKTATDPNAGKLSATGGKNGAGIGRNGISAASGKITDTTSFIKITGGIITATGGEHGAGIGAGEYCNFGDITIEDANIDATGGEGGAGIGGAYYSEVGDISIGKISGSDDITITAKSLRHGAGIGGGWTSTATNGTITINSGKITATSKEHGTGIGAGCQGTSGSITINGGNITAEGGSEGAGIGSSWLGSCGDITINGGDVKATGGYMGAGIGAGEDNSTVGKITINTDGTVTAEGGNNGVGIGSGLGEGSYRDPSKCGDIEILKGTVFAKGGTDSTGIGAGRGSTSGNITIGDKNNPNNKVIVSAQGGMKYNGGNISSYSDEEHTQEGTVTIVGDSTSVQPGDRGEGKYSTSGVVSGTDTLYCYPLYLKPKAPPDEADTLDPGKELAISNPKLLLPDNAAIVSIIATDSTGNELRRWGNNITHDPLDPNYVYLWMTGQDQKLTITYNGTEKMELDLKFDEKKGVFRLGLIDPPEDLEIPPEYNTVITPPPTPPSPSNPSSPSNPRPSGKGGIILQIGANFGEILEVPTFYLSRKALGLDKVDISTQQNAWDSMPVIKNAINRVSDIRGTYGALQNRLEHNMNDLSQSTENLTDAESRIRDADMAQEYANQVRLSISMQAAQAMLAQSNQNASQVLQLLQ